MRKQTKLVAVLSAAALLAVGASMTSFAAGWTEENGTWVYYDNDDELVTNEWKKSGSNYYYLNDDGEMATETWIDDEYYVDETGKMVTNAWLKLVLDDADIDDPDGDGEGWFWFDSKGKKVTDTKKTINGKVYYFDDDGVMEYGWYEDESGNYYYLGDEDDGARKSGWLWLERPDVDEDDISLCDDEDCTDCEEEGYYWFDKSGRVYHKGGSKKIDGKYYYFNQHGQMLYNWLVATGTDANKVNVKDNEDIEDSAKGDSIADMRYAFNVDKGWRVDGWLQVDGSYSLGRENDEDWYFFDDGEAKYDEDNSNVGATLDALGYAVDVDDDGAGTVARRRAKIKVEGKYFCFDQEGRMKTGLQAIVNDDTIEIDEAEYPDYDVYYFDEDGYMKTGKVSDVELDNGDVKTFYFETSNSHKGRGVTGEENGYLYYKGMRLEAEDDYAFFTIPSTKDGEADPLYLVNTNGKIQKPSSGTKGKKIDPEKIENKDYSIVGTLEDKEDVADVDDVNVYIVGNNKTGKISEVYYAKSATGATSSNKITADIRDIAKDASNMNDVDFGWED